MAQAMDLVHTNQIVSMHATTRTMVTARLQPPATNMNHLVSVKAIPTQHQATAEIFLGKVDNKNVVQEFTPDRRSDERIREEVSEALSAHGDIDASEIEVDVKDGMITLTGTVESRQIKRLVEDTVEGISGVQDVKNELRVMSSIENARSTSSDTTTDGASSRSSSLGKSGMTGRQSSSSQSTTSSKSVQ